MGDMTEDFKALTEARKERHANWKEQNLKIINDSGFPYIDRDEALLFRGMVSVDFYPSTGRWRANQKTYSGGAKAFLNWFNRHLILGENNVSNSNVHENRTLSVSATAP